MAFVVALVILLGALSVFNLVLTAGVVRRLRALDAGERTPRPPQAEPPPVMRGVGEQVPAFSSVTERGENVSERFLADGEVLTGVFAHGCTSCHELMPAFASLVEAAGYGRDRVLVVLVGKRASLTDELALLDPLATVIVEQRQGPVARALGVRAYPALGVIGAGGTVRASGAGIDSLRLLPTKA